MRFRIGSAAFVALMLGAATSCTERSISSPLSPSLAQPFIGAASRTTARISEIHYDNASTDVGEAIEISAAPGTSLAGWSVVLYNGSNGIAYDTDAIGGLSIVGTCGTLEFRTLNYASNGIQNGNPDAIALVNAEGVVVEYLSYGGTFTAVGGPANGLVSTDIGRAEAGTTPVGHSLQRNDDGTWRTASANTFGACNTGSTGNYTGSAVGGGQPAATVTVTPATASLNVGDTYQLAATLSSGAASFTWTSSAPAVATVSASGLVTGLAPGSAVITATTGTAPNTTSGTSAITVLAPATPLPAVRLSEIHYDNLNTDFNEAVEVEGPTGTAMAGWTVVLYNGNGGTAYNTMPLHGSIPATCGERGVVFVRYESNGVQNGSDGTLSNSPDGVALVNPTGEVVEFLSYEGAFTATDGPATGKTSVDIGVREPGSDANQSLQRNPQGVWQPAATASFGGCFGQSVPPLPPLNVFAFSGRLSGDAALPVGFQDQVFANVTNGGAKVTTTITWSSETPSVASIDQRGVITALAAGTATFRATAGDGTSAAYSLPMTEGVSSTTASYVGNSAFGDPLGAPVEGDFIIRRPQLTTSFNRARNIPNWVSYNLEATHFGSAPRCDCFTYDPQLPSDFERYTTADYTGAEPINGYSIDRGHLARSADRTAASLDNAATYYFTNIIPQASEINSGLWAQFETHLGDIAKDPTREVYIVTGAYGSRGTVRNEGRITIPAVTWKVAIITARDKSVADVRSYRDAEVVAILVPNEAAAASGRTWQSYAVTVDSVEKATGYDMLSLLRDDVEIALESGTRPPTASVNGPFSGSEGSPVSMSAAGSSDPDGDALTFAWSFGDGIEAPGTVVTHTYAQNGTYSVRLIATDVRGLADTTVTTAVVSNVAPAISVLASSTLIAGESYAATGSFNDPGADSWSATVDYGTGTGEQALPLTGKTFTLSSTYATAGSFTVTVSVTDDVTTSSRTATVRVLTLAEGIDRALALVGQSGLSAQDVKQVTNNLDQAAKQLAKGGTSNASTLALLRTALQDVEQAVSRGTATAAQTEPLRSMISRIIASLS